MCLLESHGRSSTPRFLGSWMTIKIHHILSPNQHDFRFDLSCETQLISALHDWSSCLDRSIPTNVANLQTFNFFKVFDSVRHKRLLYKLDHYGIRDNFFKMVQFLLNRNKRVLLNGSNSSWNSVASGVSQGTVLGPLLFLLYINDI